MAFRWSVMDDPSTWDWSGFDAEKIRKREGRPPAWTGMDFAEAPQATDGSDLWMIDLSAIPAPARPALAEALQAAVARLAEGGAGLDPAGAGDVLLRELIRRQMAGMLREAAAGGEGGQ